MDNRFLVVVKAKIETATHEIIQKEIYYLVKDRDRWFSDDLMVTDEEIDLEKMKL